MLDNKITLDIYCDGGARGNPGPAASAFAAIDASGKRIASKGLYIGNTTNNVAEYTSVILALNWLSTDRKSHKALSLNIFMDSMLVVNQLSGVYKIKNPKLKELYFQISEIIKQLNIEKINYTYIPREKNQQADLLVNRVLDSI